MRSSVPRDVALGPGVLDTAGARHRRARLRAVTGNDEQQALGFGGYPRPADADELLAALLERLGGYTDVTAELVSALTRGDRDRLLLAVRAGLVGDEIRLVAGCPNPDCGELVEVTLSVAELLGGETATPGGTDEVVVTTDDDTFRVRLPRGRDDDALADLTPESRSAGLWPLLADPAPGDVRAATRGALAAALAELVPAAGAPDLMRVARCPECAAWLELDPDPVDLLARALQRGADRLVVEVHSLAYHYGWAESEILSLPRQRRHQYLDLLRRQVEGRPLEDAWVVVR